MSNFPPTDLNFNSQISSKSTVKSPESYWEAPTVWSMASSNIVCHYVLGTYVCCDKRDRNYTSAPASVDQGWRKELKPGGATFEFSSTMLSRRRFAPPRSHSPTSAIWAPNTVTSLQFI